MPITFLQRPKKKHETLEFQLKRRHLATKLYCARRDELLKLVEDPNAGPADRLGSARILIIQLCHHSDVWNDAERQIVRIKEQTRPSWGGKSI